MSDIVKPTVPNRVEDMIRPPAYCALCLHYRVQERRCAAFLAGIPREIYEGRFDHRKRYEGDGGFRFQAAQPGDEEYVDMAVQHENLSNETLTPLKRLKARLSIVIRKRK